MSKSMTQVSGITKLASTKISTDNTLKEGNRQKGQDGKIQSLEQKEQNGMTQLNQMNKKIMKEKTRMKTRNKNRSTCKANKQEE